MKTQAGGYLMDYWAYYILYVYTSFLKELFNSNITT